MKPKIAIVVRGGLVVDVVATHTCEVTVIDLDNIRAGDRAPEVDGLTITQDGVDRLQTPWKWVY